MDLFRLMLLRGRLLLVVKLSGRVRRVKRAEDGEDGSDEVVQGFEGFEIGGGGVLAFGVVLLRVREVNTRSAFKR